MTFLYTIPNRKLNVPQQALLLQYRMINLSQGHFITDNQTVGYMYFYFLLKLFAFVEIRRPDARKQPFIDSKIRRSDDRVFWTFIVMQMTISGEVNHCSLLWSSKQ